MECSSLPSHVVPLAKEEKAIIENYARQHDDNARQCDL